MIRVDTIKRWWWAWVVVLVFLVGVTWVTAHPRPVCAKGSSGSRVSVTRSSPSIPKGTYTVKPGQSAPVRQPSPPSKPAIRTVDRSTPVRIVQRTYVIERERPVYIERNYGGGLSWWDYMMLYQWTHPRPVYYPATPMSGAPAEHQQYVQKGCE